MLITQYRFYEFPDVTRLMDIFLGILVSTLIGYFWKRRSSIVIMIRKNYTFISVGVIHLLLLSFVVNGLDPLKYLLILEMCCLGIIFQNDAVMDKIIRRIVVKN